MIKSYNEWLLEQHEPLNEDVGTALVALTTILVGIPVGTAVSKTITSIIETINNLRQERKFAEANMLAKKSLDKYKNLGKEKLQEEEGGEGTSNVVGNVEASGPYTNRSKKKERPDPLKMKTLEETIDSMFSLPKFTKSDTFHED